MIGPIRACLFLPAVVALSFGVAHASDFPREFFVSTPTRSVTFHALYILDDEGRIWTKPSQSPASEWRLLNGTGLPPGVARVKTISADDHHVAAQSEKDELWRYEAGQWSDTWGFPGAGPAFMGKLKLPANVRGWTLSVRGPDVLYYEDPKGNDFHYGDVGCTTVYALQSEGQRIYMGDPWFPPDFSREMCGPNRGARILENVAASASTTLAITPSGELFTRFHDYDINGGTPFFIFRYFDLAPVHGIPGHDKLSAFETRALPGEGWIPQPSIDLGQRGRLTRNLTVLQTGTGNLARELRVQALGPSGLSGYYFKTLEENGWSFHVTGEEIDPSDFLDNRPGPRGVGETRDRRYVGKILGARIETSDLNYHCSPIRFEITLSSGAKIPLTLHTVDAWSLVATPDPEEAPVAAKPLKATLEIPADARDSEREDVREFVRRHLEPYHLKTFALALTANGYEAILRPVRLPFFGGADLNWRVKLKPATAPEGFGPFDVASASDAELEQAILKAQTRIRQADEIFESLKRKQSAAAYPGWFLTPTLMLAEVASVVTTTRYTVPWFWNWRDAFSEHLPALAATARDAVRMEARALKPWFEKERGEAEKLARDARAELERRNLSR